MVRRSLIPLERIQTSILVIRDERVILDSDLASLYGVTTKRLNEQVRRNRKRFPDDFMFELSREEKDEVVANCDHLRKLKFSATLPHAFTEHGAIMAANVLNSDRAVEASVEVVRAFVRLRNLVSSHRAVTAELAKLETHVAKHDKEIKAIFEAIRQLMVPPKKSVRRIGFRPRSIKK